MQRASYQENSYCYTGSVRYPPNPKYSNSKVNRAGDCVRQYKVGAPEYEAAVRVINEWRLAHAYPINTFVSTLRKKVWRMKDPIVAQRLKRLPTIIDKLDRYPDMELSRMQDIGGVRGIVNTVQQVHKLAEDYLDSRRFTHALVRHDDYITHPKPDGYRGIHLIFKYHNTLARNKRAQDYEGLLVELQLRTNLQHAWSTAVETMGTFKNASFKSRKGSKEWLEFFALTASSFAYLEGTPPLGQYAHMNVLETFKRMKRLDLKHKITEQIKGYATAANVIHSKYTAARYYNVIALDIVAKEVKITSFRRDQVAEASQYYKTLEDRSVRGEKIESVLVSAGRLNSLKLAYPNYFLDIQSFIEKIEVIYGEIV